MSKFTKRLQKLVKKNLNGALLIGTVENQIDDLLESFNTVFIFAPGGFGMKRRNLIPIKDSAFVSNLNEVDAIFINQGYDINVMRAVEPIVRKIYPVVFVNIDFARGDDLQEFFRSSRYEMVDINDQYQIWKLIRR